MVVCAAVALVLAIFVAALWLPNTLQAESGARGGGVGFGTPRIGGAGFVQPRIDMGALILPVEVSAANRCIPILQRRQPHVCCSDIPIQRTGKPIDEIECRQERNRCSPAESPGITGKAKHEDLEHAVVGGGPEGDGKSPGVCAP